MLSPVRILGPMKHPLKFAFVFAIVAEAGAEIAVQSPGWSSAPGPESLYGTWGTATQCAAHSAGRKDDYRLFPYIIDDQWIQHGLIYCRVNWRDHHSGADGTDAQAFVQCGEDSVRDYRVVFRLREGLLQMRWSRDFTTRRLQPCE